MQLTLKLTPQSNYSLLINEIYTTLSQIHITLLDVKLGKLQQVVTSWTITTTSKQ